MTPLPETRRGKVPHRLAPRFPAVRESWRLIGANCGKSSSLYGRKVAEGEWRDYALDFTPHHAVFSIFRHSSEVPLYRIEKDPKLGRRQGAYSVVVAGGQILKRGHDLTQVIGVLDRRLKIVT